MKDGEELIIENAHDTMNYQEEGIIIAGGATVMAFVSILKNLNAQNKLGNNKFLFANDLETNIVREKAFEKILDHNFSTISSERQTDKYVYGNVPEKEYPKL